MAKKNFYAVKQGHTPGIYKTWDECKKQVDGYSGASYKGFATLEEAKEFLGTSAESANNMSTQSTSTSETIAYVDGSYDDTLKEFSYGVIIFYNGIEEHFAEKFNTPNLVEMRNVAGEIMGAQKAMQFCVDNGINSIDLYYDYEGIAKWCMGEWKATKTGTKSYKSFYNSIKDKLKVNFIKVAGHSGDKYNDLADELAKSALGLAKPPEISQGMNSMTANKIKFDDLMIIFDLLKNDISDLVLEDFASPYGKGFTLSISKPTKQKLKVVYYADKNKLWLQGKKEELFNQLSLYIIELLETDEVPQFLNTVHQLNIDKDVIETEFEQYLPNASGKLNDKISNYLHQAIYNLKITGDMFNATFLVEPALRPLEGVLKIALLANNIPIREDDKYYDSFFVFSKVDGRYVLDAKYVKSEHTDELKDYLSKCYSHYRNHRHSLSHWDNPTEAIDTTRVIRTATEAHTLIKDTIKIIDDYYKLK